ncbi:MAG: hypothetical protein ABIT05_16880 [Chitinophagaceae bacterium]
MTIAFTICSNSFLAHTKTMLDSLRVHHPEIGTFIFLVDLPDASVDYSIFAPADVIVADEKIIPGFAELLDRYNVIELSTSLRPFVIRYLQDRFAEASKLYYIDPDMVVYDRLDVIDQLLENQDIIITPHFLQPLPLDGQVPFENLALNYGTYNLGFFALKPHTTNTNSFLNWWGERTSQFGHIDPANGYFTDQIWFNLVPLFFKKVHTLLHPGYNMAAWNLHERSISSYEENGNIMLGSGERLVIYHFSSWNIKHPDQLSRYYNRYSFTDRPDLVKLYEDYRLALVRNRVDFFSKIPCALPYNRKTVKRSRVQKILLPGIKLMRRVWQKI